MGGGVYRNCLLLAFKIEIRLESKPTIGTGLSEGSVGIRFGGWSTKLLLWEKPNDRKKIKTQLEARVTHDSIQHGNIQKQPLVPGAWMWVNLGMLGKSTQVVEAAVTFVLSAF